LPVTPPRARSGRAPALVTTLLLVIATLVATLATATPTTASGIPPSPFEGRSLFVDPGSNAAQDADALASTDPARADALRKIATRSQADWFGDWNAVSTVQRDVANRIATITQAGAYPVLVAYDIPLRDCGSYSGGGAASADAYRAWISAFRAGIGSTPAAVILEPDALAQLDCLSATNRTARLKLLKEATLKLASGGNVAVYIDAGHAGWIPADVMAQRLASAGVAAARGFSLNVSNFGFTADQINYGSAIAPTIGWKRFVVDTSRNGLGPATGEEAWCNPTGRALGPVPTAATGSALVDAYLWIKHPGESDGTCAGGPAAGTWWRDYAVGLAQRAS
jgi:endoglucanase